MKKLLFFLLLVGCVKLDPQGYEWDPTPTHPAMKQTFWLTVSQKDMDIICPPSMSTHGRKPLACAVSAWDENVCYIYSTKSKAGWLLDEGNKWVPAHEEKHCAGYDHKPIVDLEIKEDIFN